MPKTIFRKNSDSLRFTNRQPTTNMEGALAKITIICFPSGSEFYQRSRNEAPVGRRLTFVPVTFKPVAPFTARHSLLPASIPNPHHNRRTPRCAVPTKAWSDRGFHVSLGKYAGLGACYGPGSVWVTRTKQTIVLPVSNTVWSSVSTTSACHYSRPLSQVQISSPYQLSSTHRVCGCQEGVPLTICTPHDYRRA